jgi:hypothetical protein
MRTTRKPPPKKKTASLAGSRTVHPKKAAAAAAKRGDYGLISQRQLKEADKMLGRIERRGEALLANADLLLKRVS